MKFNYPDFSDMDGLIEDQINDLFIHIGKNNGCNLHESNNVNWVISQSSAWPNFIFGTNLTGIELSKLVSETTKRIENKEAPPLWILGPKVQTPELIENLELNGLRLSAQWTGMVADLSSITSFQMPKDFEAFEVNNLTLLDEWIQVANKFLFNKRKLDIEIYKLFINDEKIKMYIGKLNNEPVATSLLFLSNGISSLYMISTANDHRKKGLGSAITNYSMIKAKERGYNLILLHATSMGRSMYQKLGFQSFGTFNIYWKVGKSFKL